MISDIYYYIDPQIKGMDKDIFQKFEKIMLNNKYKSIESDYQKCNLLIALVADYPETTQPFQIYVKYEQANLELFNENQVQDNSCFLIESLGDLELSERLINDLILELQKKFLSELLQNKTPTKSRLSTLLKKNKEQSEQNLILQFTADLYQNRPENITELKTMLSYQLLYESYDFTVEELSLIEDEHQWIIQTHTNQLLYIDSQKDSIKAASYVVLREYFYQMNLIQQNKLEWDHLKQVLNTLDYPLCILGYKQEMMFINSKMSELALSQKQINGLDNDSFIESRENLYRVEKYQLDTDKSLLVFHQAHDDQNYRPSSTELGIISSSIAHELNNPLGGLLASLDVLLLDDLEEEVIERLLEMKKVVIRCKKLVETFLGFSRSEVDLKKWEGTELNIKDSIQQANELIRFRLVENNLHLNLNLVKENMYAHIYNPHILSMIFYLIFGELLTNFSHYTLLNSQKSSQFDLFIEERSHSVVMRFENQIKINQSFFRSRLFKHLLEIEGLKALVENGKIEITYK